MDLRSFNLCVNHEAELHSNRWARLICVFFCLFHCMYLYGLSRRVIRTINESMWIASLNGNNNGQLAMSISRENDSTSREGCHRYCNRLILMLLCNQFQRCFTTDFNVALQPTDFLLCFVLISTSAAIFVHSLKKNCAREKKTTVKYEITQYQAVCNRWQTIINHRCAFALTRSLYWNNKW